MLLHEALDGLGIQGLEPTAVDASLHKSEEGGKVIAAAPDRSLGEVAIDGEMVEVGIKDPRVGGDNPFEFWGAEDLDLDKEIEQVTEGCLHRTNRVIIPVRRLRNVSVVGVNEGIDVCLADLVAT